MNALCLRATVAEDVNVALNKPTWQGPNATLASGRAVDGGRNMVGGQCSQAASTDEQWAWWGVDLGAMYLVSSVYIINRADCCCKCKAGWRSQGSRLG
jgi:hypothetical protein